MRVALVYDRVNKWGGAERVLLTLHELFPQAPLFTSVFNPQTAPWASVFTIHTSFLQSLPFARSSHEYYAPFMPLAFEQFTFDDYDLVISVTSEAAKGIITKPRTKHICYCLTPTRYLWSGYKDYFRSEFFRFISNPAVSYLRTWDTIAANRPDRFVAISEAVRERIHKYYQKDALVIYPPVTPPKITRGLNKKLPEEYFLIVSRLVPYKRIDIAVQACTQLRLPLVIIGSGSEEKKLRRMAGPTVRFVGSLTDEDVAAYYEQCTALLFPGEEDFGLTILEAQAFGKPVIAYKKGGALETIVEGKTGVFFSTQSKDSLQEVLRTFDPKHFSRRDSLKQAEKFGREKFKQEFMRLVSSII